MTFFTKQCITLLCLLTCTQYSYAYDVEVDGIYYNIVDKGNAAEVTFGENKYSGTVSIPESILVKGTEYNVMAIADEAFYNCTDLISIDIPLTVNKIGNSAFKDCTSLVSFTTPSSVTDIGASAFYGCTNLNTVRLSEFITSIKGYTFYGCSSLKSIIIPPLVKWIGSSAFYNCSSLTDITIPPSVKSLEYEAFYGCSGLQKVIISDIAAWAQIDCEYSDENPLLYAHHLYLNDEEITQLSIPSSVTKIGNNSFINCKSITSVTIPSSVTTIGEGAFCGCSCLTGVTIPSSVTTIDGCAFEDCVGLMSVTIPSSVTTIGARAFYGCSKLTSVTIPPSVTTIDYKTFYECTGLMSIQMPSSVTTIGISAFYGCTGLTAVTIPSSVTTISEYSFEGCTGLTLLTIGNSVKTIKQYAFANCKNLETVTCSTENVPSLGLNVFKDSYVRYATLKVPNASVSLYKAASQWKEFGNINAIDDILNPTNVALYDEESYTNNTIYDNISITYTRTFNNADWQAFYIPFAISYSDWSSDFDFAYINGIRQQDTDNDGIIDYQVMDIVKVTNGSLKPNTPYMIKAKTTGEKTITVSNATMCAATQNSIDCSTTVAKYTFTGTYSDIPAEKMQSGNYYAMGEGTLRPCTNALKPFRWYMSVTSRDPMITFPSSEVNIRINVIGEEDTETGIESIISDGESQSYDLLGRKVCADYKGIVIKNGKKYLNR